MRKVSGTWMAGTWVMSALLATACGTTTTTSADASVTAADAAGDASADDAAGADVAAADIQTGPQPAAPKGYADTCPDFTAGGKVTITSGGYKRTVYVSVPADTSAPLSLLYLWHGLGDSGNNFQMYFGAQSIADDKGAVVITPDNCCVKGLACCKQINGWAFLDADGAEDAALFDDIHSCVTSQLQIDQKRVYSAGFSAGGLWTTWLLTHRSEYLAAVAPFSGGVGLFEYVTPFWKIPVLGSFGGENDIFGGVINFHDMMLTLFDDLKKDGIFSVQCDHGLGHTVPPEGVSYATEFLFQHTFGMEKSPFEAGLTDPFPSYCKITE